MIVYFYDLKGKDLREYNRVKRRFYYNLARLSGVGMVWRSKSVFSIDDKYERYIDSFLKEYIPFLEVYKVHTEKICSL
ncbi:hypothetical protein KAW38_00205 [Candidatus Micrarchaeota archaeon]|nr:hypothetical protein [Candidatus Micrarchaeota archaeon]